MLQRCMMRIGSGSPLHAALTHLQRQARAIIGEKRVDRPSDSNCRVAMRAARPIGSFTCCGFPPVRCCHARAAGFRTEPLEGRTRVDVTLASSRSIINSIRWTLVLQT
ncbi:hypothetical protein QQF64_025788 [Cirrhinus molitorella]|uniref:Uncharacterized protein n=1 Tax=Cirrhinus molitorella TaxID=172907 RepID=A0ABR3NRG0_9TELE